MAGIKSIRIDLPPWDPEEPTFWFKRVKGCFKLCKDGDGNMADVSAEDKLSLVGNVLPPAIMKEYKDYVMNNDFDGFEKAVCSATAKTDGIIYREVVGAKLQDG